jgi:hypothetical protein
MFWALARVSFRAGKIVSCNKKKNFMVYDQNYHNCSTLDGTSISFEKAFISRLCFEIARQFRLSIDSVIWHAI